MVPVMVMLRILRLLLPALIPSWRFFRAVEPSPRVEVCADGSSDWSEVCLRPDHVPLRVMLRRMLWNPRWNETLYLVSLAARVVEERSPHAMRELERRVQRARPGERIRLRLVFVERRGERLTREVLYQSAPFGEAR